MRRALALRGRVGANVDPESGVTSFGFLWPKAEQEKDAVVVELFRPDSDGDKPDRIVGMHSEGDGFYVAEVPRNLDGWTYFYRRGGDEKPLFDYLGAEVRRPGEAGPATQMRVVDFSRIKTPPALPRRDRDRIAEINPVTVTEGGTIWDARTKLAKLRELGFNVVEVMPPTLHQGDLSRPKDYPGPNGPRPGYEVRGWGYDIEAMAMNEGWEVLAGFVREAHEQGIAVYFDLIWNHFAGFPDDRIGDVNGGSTPWGTRLKLDNPHLLAGAVVQVVDRLIQIGADGIRVDAAWGLDTFEKGMDEYTRIVFEAISRVAKQALDEGRIARPLDLIVESPPDFFVAHKNWIGKLPGIRMSRWGDDFHHQMMLWTTKRQGDAEQLKQARLPNFYTLPDFGSDTRPRWIGNAAAVADLFTMGSMFEIENVEDNEAEENHDTDGNNPLGEPMVATIANTRLQDIGVKAEVTAMLLDVVPEGAETPAEFMAALAKSSADAAARADAVFREYRVASPTRRADLYAAVFEAVERYKTDLGAYWNGTGSPTEPVWADTWRAVVKGYKGLAGTKVVNLTWNDALRLGRAEFAQQAADDLAQLVTGGDEAMQAWLDELKAAEQLELASVAFGSAGFQKLTFFPHGMAIDAPRHPWVHSKRDEGIQRHAPVGRSLEHGTPIQAAKIPHDPSTVDQMVDRRGLRPEIEEQYQQINAMNARRQAVIGNGAARVAFPWGQVEDINGKQDQKVVVGVTGEGPDLQLAIMNRGDEPVEIPLAHIRSELLMRQANRNKQMGHPIDLPDAPFVLTLNTGRHDAELDGMTADGQAIVVGGRRTITLEQTAPAGTRNVDAPVAAPASDQVAEVQPPQGAADALTLAQRTIDQGAEPPAGAVASSLAPASTTVPKAQEEGAEPAPAPQPADEQVAAAQFNAPPTTATALMPVAGFLATTAVPPSAANQPPVQVEGLQGVPEELSALGFQPEELSGEEEELFGTQVQQWAPAPASVLTGAPVPTGVSGVMPFQQQEAAAETQVWDPKSLFESR